MPATKLTSCVWPDHNFLKIGGECYFSYSNDYEQTNLVVNLPLAKPPKIDVG